MKTLGCLLLALVSSCSASPAHAAATDWLKYVVVQGVFCLERSGVDALAKQFLIPRPEDEPFPIPAGCGRAPGGPRGVEVTAVLAGPTVDADGDEFYVVQFPVKMPGGVYTNAYTLAWPGFNAPKDPSTGT